ncbi:MAG: hypothetical protein NT049_18015, partial [Planctomycetota bacterium]|nr:hypothetical protein [Planctomycetota bacterium]
LFCTAFPEMLGLNPIYCRDTIQAAKARGIDYRQLINSCLASEKPAMHQLFWLASDGGIEDEAAREGHVCFIGLILTRTGDAFFAECLGRESGATQETIRQSLLLSAGYTEGKAEQVVDWLRKNYPKVFPETWRPK